MKEFSNDKFVIFHWAKDYNVNLDAKKDFIWKVRIRGGADFKWKNISHLFIFSYKMQGKRYHTKTECFIWNIIFRCKKRDDMVKFHMKNLNIYMNFPHETDFKKMLTHFIRKGHTWSRFIWNFVVFHDIKIWHTKYYVEKCKYMS